MTKVKNGAIFKCCKQTEECFLTNRLSRKALLKITICCSFSFSSSLFFQEGRVKGKRLTKIVILSHAFLLDPTNIPIFCLFRNMLISKTCKNVILYSIPQLQSFYQAYDNYKQNINYNVKEYTGKSISIIKFLVALCVLLLD